VLPVSKEALRDDELGLLSREKVVWLDLGCDNDDDEGSSNGEEAASPTAMFDDDDVRRGEGEEMTTGEAASIIVALSAIVAGVVPEVKDDLRDAGDGSGAEEDRLAGGVSGVGDSREVRRDEGGERASEDPRRCAGSGNGSSFPRECLLGDDDGEAGRSTWCGVGSID